MAFKNSIVKYVPDEPIDGVLFNPDNIRIHPREQQEAVEGLVEKHGWVKPIIINMRTSEEWGRDRNVATLLDGQDRCKLATQHGETGIPAIYIDVGPEAERELIVGLDASAGMAAYDRAKLADLLTRIDPQSE